MSIGELEREQQVSLQELDQAEDAAALEALRVRYLGRQGRLPILVKGLKDVAPEHRPEFGKQLQAWRVKLEQGIAARATEFAGTESKTTPFDYTLPGQWFAPGVRHPVSQVIEESAAIFSRLGFSVADGPDIETRFNNFTALNTPAHHPSMDESDTFWLGNDLLLRTQTSPVQVRMMVAHEPPLRIITPGRTYRRDTTDATHSANFHQIEGLYVDTVAVSLADLKATLRYYAREMMGARCQVRFRPHFFPFTEPSVEVDFSCHVCEGKGCRVCKMSGWIEIAGAGMVDPRVYGFVSQARGDAAYDQAKVYGYAFGFGVERIAMIKYGIPDIRWLYSGDMRILQQFG